MAQFVDSNQIKIRFHGSFFKQLYPKLSLAIRTDEDKTGRVQSKKLSILIVHQINPFEALEQNALANLIDGLFIELLNLLKFFEHHFRQSFIEFFPGQLQIFRAVYKCVIQRKCKEGNNLS